MSTELFIIPLEESRYLVYAPLRLAAFVADAATVNLMVDLQEGQPVKPDDETEATIEFLRRLEFIDAGEEMRPITRFKGDPCPTEITLFLTTDCNLRCTYCYASAGDTPKRAMTLETAIRGIDYIIGNAVKTGKEGIEIAYHGGGEPTVNWATMTESFAHAKRRTDELGLSLRVSTATNGVMSSQRADWIIENLNGASVSFDGLPQAHDKHRLTVTGQGSSSHVLATLRRFDEADYDYGVRLTITRDQIRHMPESVRFVCENLRPRRIQVEPAYQLGRWQDAPSAETAGFIEAFRTAQSIAREFGHDLFFSGARVGSLSNHFCGVTQDSFALSSDGNVSACYEVFLEENRFADKFFYGTPDESNGGYRFQLPILETLRSQTVDQREFCQGCFAKWSCGGDCYHKSLSVNGDGVFRGSDRCHIIRELTKDQILDRIEQAGGLFWHEAPGDQTAAKGKELLL